MFYELEIRALSSEMLGAVSQAYEVDVWIDSAIVMHDCGSCVGDMRRIAKSSETANMKFVKSGHAHQCAISRNGNGYDVGTQYDEASFGIAV